jgi:hypothetical protein
MVSPWRYLKWLYLEITPVDASTTTLEVGSVGGS